MSTGFEKIKNASSDDSNKLPIAFALVLGVGLGHFTQFSFSSDREAFFNHSLPEDLEDSQRHDVQLAVVDEMSERLAAPMLDSTELRKKNEEIREDIRRLTLKGEELAALQKKLQRELNSNYDALVVTLEKTEISARSSLNLRYSNQSLRLGLNNKNSQDYTLEEKKLLKGFLSNFPVKLLKSEIKILLTNYWPDNKDKYSFMVRELERWRDRDLVTEFSDSELFYLLDQFGLDMFTQCFGQVGLNRVKSYSNEGYQAIIND